MPLCVCFGTLRFIAMAVKRNLLPLISTLALLGSSLPAQAQLAKPAASASAPATVVAAGPRWSDLTPAQQTILKPLAPSWESLDSSRKRKWMSVAQSYPKLAPAEQEKMQSRMAQWAALSPRERTVARLNFAETKKVAPSDRTANWDAYQALPAEDRQKLAAEASPPPTGAAIAPKQSTTGKVTPVPITRHTTGTIASGTGSLPPSINPKTLLPQAPKPVKAASAPSN